MNLPRTILTSKKRSFAMTMTEIIEEDPFLVPLESPSNEVKIKSTIKDMLSFVKDLSVNTEGAYKKITSTYKQARDWKKAIETKRKELVEPFRAQIAVINDKAKSLSDPLDNVIEIANAKSAGYLRILEEAKKKEEEETKKLATLFDAEDEVYVPPLEKTIRGEGAILVTKTEKTFRVLDIFKVPLKYLMIDEEAVQRDLRLGVGEIPGLDIYTIQKTSLRTR
jgi:hypothetical protein